MVPAPSLLERWMRLCTRSAGSSSCVPCLQASRVQAVVPDTIQELEAHSFQAANAVTWKAENSAPSVLYSKTDSLLGDASVQHSLLLRLDSSHLQTFIKLVIGLSEPGTFRTARGNLHVRYQDTSLNARQYKPSRACSKFAQAPSNFCCSNHGAKVSFRRPGRLEAPTQANRGGCP